MNSAQHAEYDCRKATCCGEDDPFPNFTQDRVGYKPGQEQLACVSQYTPPLPAPDVWPEMNIGCLHLKTECIRVLASETDECGAGLESESYLCAVSATTEACGGSIAGEQTPGDPGGTQGGGGGDATPTPPVVEYGNHAQTYCSTCADGTVTCYTLPQNSVIAISQAAADAQALAIAINRANAYRICVANEPDYCCVGRSYTFDFTFVGGLDPKSVSIDSGALPDGLSISGATISGVPTTTGAFSFTIAIADGRVVSHKTITMYAIQITPLVLPDANYGVLYSQQMTATGAPVGATLNFYISSGALPDGLSITPGGLISGTPIAGLPATFTVAVGVT